MWIVKATEYKDETGGFGNLVDVKLLIIWGIHILEFAIIIALL